MAILTSDQLNFLQAHDVPLSRVYNASGKKRREYQAAMRSLDMVIAYGVSPCEQAGHTLRTRAGHCAQCDVSRIAYQMRADDPGQVYVAYSGQLNMSKIGVANDTQERLRNLNSQRYGSTDDWEIVYERYSLRAGRAELGAHSRLKEYQWSRSFTKTGNLIECRELFACVPEFAVKAVEGSVEELESTKNRT